MLIVNSDGGLGNKLKSVVAGLRFGDKIKDQVKINFPNHLHNNFIEVKQFSKHFFNEEVGFDTWRLDFLPWEKEKRLIVDKKFVMVDSKDCFWILPDNSIDFQYTNIRKEIIDDYLKYWRAVSFSDEIMRMVEDRSNQMDFDNCIGVHIRTWRDWEIRLQNLYDLNLYIDCMENKDKNFFIFTDDDRVLDQLVDRFGTQKISFVRTNSEKVKHLKSDRSREHFADSLVDCILLSKFNDVIGTYQSSFTEVSWWLSGCKNAVEIPIPNLIKENDWGLGVD